MTVVGTKPHPIFLAGRWVESPDVLEIANPADPSTPAGSTYNATEAQYDEAVEAAHVDRAPGAVERRVAVAAAGTVGEHAVAAGLGVQPREVSRAFGACDPGRHALHAAPAAERLVGPAQCHAASGRCAATPA